MPKTRVNFDFWWPCLHTPTKLPYESGKRRVRAQAPQCDEDVVCVNREGSSHSVEVLETREARPVPMDRLDVLRLAPSGTTSCISPNSTPRCSRFVQKHNTRDGHSCTLRSFIPVVPGHKTRNPSKKGGRASKTPVRQGPFSRFCEKQLIIHGMHLFGSLYYPDLKMDRSCAISNARYGRSDGPPPRVSGGPSFRT